MSYEKDDALQLVKKGETIMMQGRPSSILLIARLITLGFAILGLLLIFNYSLSTGYNEETIFLVELTVIIVGLAVALAIFGVWYKTYYIITDRRVRYYSGVLGVQNRDMTLDDVENVQYQQGILGMLFNYGDINIRSAADDKPITFQGIPYPKKFADEIRDLAKV